MGLEPPLAAIPRLLLLKQAEQGPLQKITWLSTWLKSNMYVASVVQISTVFVDLLLHIRFNLKFQMKTIRDENESLTQEVCF